MRQNENAGFGKELLPAQQAIIIERAVMSKYAPLLISESERNLTLEQAKFEWIKTRGKLYRELFDEHKNEWMEFYKKDPEQAIDYIQTELERELERLQKVG